MDTFKEILGDVDRFKINNSDEIFTPSNIVQDILDLLPESVWNSKTRFLDICCKSGNFLVEIYNRLDRILSSDNNFKDPVKRRKHILENQIYGICTDSFEEMMIKRRMLGDPFSDNENISTIDYIHPVSGASKQFKELVQLKKYKTQKEREQAFGQIQHALKEKFKQMDFDVVVGNPPYNNDMYLSFVMMGHKLAKQFTLMITPAKWQAKGGGQNDLFRKEIVPYMSKIVYYKDPEDVFPNAPMHGDSITYYLIGKINHTDKRILSDGICKVEKEWSPELGFDHNYISVMHKVIRDANFKPIINSNDPSITPAKSYFTSRNFGDVSEDISSKYFMWSSARCIRVPEVVFKNTDNMDKYKVYCNHYITNSPVLHILNPNVAAVREACLIGFGDEDKCKSIKSYYTCKLIWYIVSGLCVGNASREAFANVPAPDAFDHIFTDEELYKKYNLTDDEIKLIESVIKERK